ncbi:hypothetical protein [Desulfoluna spongiiphila]|uniref:YhhN-like protein n=1 Tax=Desulfoluna spongiiphila TaxID=419481 RepID=A0A1G5HDE8_9BACT|nr:hypothetical protein [Desulfoluna spongiiphila]SCY61360.1 hypothetical protein SAMN05216233_11387 [Desulfoluna spongiiphila]
MIPFDMKTSIFTYILVNHIYSIVLGITWYRNRTRRWGIGFFFADFVFKSAGMTLACLRGALPPVISIVAANVLMFSGTLFMLFGMARFLKVRLRQRPYGLYTLLFTVLYAICALVYPDIRARIVIFSGMLAPVVAHTAWLVYTSPHKDLRSHASPAGIAFALFAVVFGVRVACALTGDPIASYFHAPITDSFLTILCQVLSVYLAYALLLMISNRIADLPDRGTVPLTPQGPGAGAPGPCVCYRLYRKIFPRKGLFR